MANNKVQLSDGTVLLDLTGDTVTPENLLSGATAHNAAGNRINGAVAPVRYDAAQTLTDAQKAQARANIAAAPSGFGLGSDGPSEEYKSTNGDNITATGWYIILPEVAGFDIGYSLVRHESYSPSYGVQTLYLLKDTTGFGRNVALRRVKESNTWYPWEWVNPPMRLGVEYRTTERYLDKPVYVRAVNFGTLPNTNTKDVTWATPGVVLAILSVEATSSLGDPIGLGASLSGTEITATTTKLYIKSAGDYSGNTAVFRVKYTKTTD